jgi:general stress protein YciG
MKRKKSAAEMTVREHMQSIAALGGRARAKKLPAERQSEIGRNAGLASAKARAEKLSPGRRREIARKAAAARWGKKAGGEAISGVPAEPPQSRSRKPPRKSAAESSI